MPRKPKYVPKPFMLPKKVSYNRQGVASTTKDKKWGNTKAAWNQHLKAKPKAFTGRAVAFESAFLK